jgi:mercuric ion transport protein
MAVSIVAALGASVCCIGPIVAVTFGITSLAALGKYEPLRPVFTAMTLAFLGLAFYSTYRGGPAECEPGSVCSAHGPDRVNRINRFVLWVVTGIALIILTFPTWSEWILG